RAVARGRPRSSHDDEYRKDRRGTGRDCSVQPVMASREGRESMIIPGNRRLSAESFRALGIALFGEDWEAIMAQELSVDRSIVGSWATQGPPADRADALRHIAGYRRERIRVVMGSPGMPEHDLSALQRANALLAEY